MPPVRTILDLLVVIVRKDLQVKGVKLISMTVQVLCAKMVATVWIILVISNVIVVQDTLGNFASGITTRLVMDLRMVVLKIIQTNALIIMKVLMPMALSVHVWRGLSVIGVKNGFIIVKMQQCVVV